MGPWTSANEVQYNWNHILIHINGEEILFLVSLIRNNLNYSMHVSVNFLYKTYKNLHYYRPAQLTVTMRGLMGKKVKYLCSISLCDKVVLMIFLRNYFFLSVFIQQRLLVLITHHAICNSLIRLKYFQSLIFWYLYITLLLIYSIDLKAFIINLLSLWKCSHDFIMDSLWHLYLFSHTFIMSIATFFNGFRWSSVYVSFSYFTHYQHLWRVPDGMLHQIIYYYMADSYFPFRQVYFAELLGAEIDILHSLTD